MFLIELSVIWLIYFAYGFVTKYDMPLWMTTFLVIAVDRICGYIANLATRKRNAVG